MTTAIPNLAVLLERQADLRPEDPAYIFLVGDELRQSRISYRELDAHAKVIAQSLRKHKAQGERALLLYPPGLEFIAAFFGCLYAGVVAVPAYPPRLNRNALRILAIAQDCEASLALMTNATFSRREALLAHSPAMGKMRWCATDNLSPQGVAEYEPFPWKQESLAYLQYTSGSTADPKGVMVSHGNVLENCGYIAKTFHHCHEDVSVSWLPHFHDLGLVHGILQPLYCGFPGYLMAPMTFLQRPLNWLRSISEFRATHSDGPNFAYELCLARIAQEEKNQLDLSSWKVALNGAEPVFPETIERFTAAFANCGFDRTAVYPAYGLAEATLVVSGGKRGNAIAYCSVESEALERKQVVFSEERIPGSRTLAASGEFSPPLEIEIVEPELGRKCPPGEVGEIWVAGPSVALGYWQRPEETEQVFKARLAADDPRTFLRTGDLGFIQAGALFVTGRLKELIIIRGRNYYPQDIERTARESCRGTRLGTGAAFSIPVGTEEHLILVQEVSRRQKIQHEDLFVGIRRAIAEEYEIQVQQIVLVASGSIPKTSSGKIQRGLCRKQFLRGGLKIIGSWCASHAIQEDYKQAPSVHNLEHWLQCRVASRLGVAPDKVDVERPLSQMGLDSLNAVELTHEMQRALRIVWSPAALLDDGTIAKLAAKAAGELEREQAVEKFTKEKKIEYPLSYGQQALWFLQQLSPENTAYNVVQAMRIRSRLDVPALAEAFQELIDRHSALRTTFTNSGGKPVQHVHPRQLSFHYEDAQGWNEKEMQERLTAEAATRFDLEQGPLFRVRLFRRSVDEHILLLLAHHIIVDLWSLAQITAEFAALYRSKQTCSAAEMPAPESEYRDFVRWQAEMLAGGRGQELWSYWNNQLSGELPALDLPTDYRRPVVQTYRGASFPFRISQQLASALKSVGQECGATVYMTLLAAFQVLLHCCSGQQEIVIGSPTFGRPRAQFDRVVGYFVNPVVIRSSIWLNSPFQEFLKQVRRTVLQALEHQDYPFTLLTEKIQPVRDSSRSPLFQVMFAMQRAQLLDEQDFSAFAFGQPGERMELHGLEMEPFGLEQRVAQFDLTLVMAETKSGLAGTFEYNTALFRADTIYRMARQFEILLQSIAAGPTQEISRLSLLTVQQKREVVQEAKGQELSMLPIPVHELFERQAARTPDALAIVCEGQQLSYGELNDQANQLARRIRGSASWTGIPVGVALKRSTQMIVSLLAVLKAGAVYVPLDPEYPDRRVDFILDDARVGMVITQKRLLNLSPRPDLKILYLENDAIPPEAEKSAWSVVAQNDPAYIIYTSGSTGQPKGVLVSHGAFSNHMQWLAHEFPLHENDRVLFQYSPAFDASLAEVFHPLISGAALVIASEGGQHDPTYLIDLMCQHKMTSLDAVPALLKVLVESHRFAECDCLRRITSGGDALARELQERIYHRLKTVELVNMYGPTETTITACFHRCQPQSNEERIPIGIPIANTQVHVLDSNLDPAPSGVVGEIFVGGRGVAIGYLNRPHLTAERFVPDPYAAEPGARLYRTGDLGRRRPDGSIECMGREDNQVKVRGFRIELGEIEAELKRHRSVLDAVVSLRLRRDNTKYIVAYVQPVSREAVATDELRVYLAERLPEYMLPGVIVSLESLPRLSSGKIDRRALPEPQDIASEPRVIPARLQIEKELVRIWQEVLGRSDVGIYNNFFELGGDSILSIQVVSRAAEVGLQLTPKQIFQFQTIAALAQVAGKSVSSVENNNNDALGPAPLTPIQRWFFEQDLKDPNRYVQSVVLRLRKRLDPKLLEDAFRHVVARHDALCAAFEPSMDGWRQRAGGIDSMGAWRCFSFQHLKSDDQAAEILKASATMRSSLNFRSGPMVCAAYFELPDGPHVLEITAHHLAIDAVSWRILLDQLERAYLQLSRGEPIVLSRKTLSFRRWSQLLSDHAQTESLYDELDWWDLNLSGPTGHLPADGTGENSSASSETIFVRLLPDETRQLLHDLPRTSRAEIKDVLLAALALALSEWTGESRVLIDIEGHGREEIIEAADVTQTIGWFTTLYPVRLEIPASATPGQVLKSVREQLRAVPQNGIGYGLLRYLAAASISSRLRDFPGAQVSFNYLGQLDQMLSPTSIFVLEELKGPVPGAIGRRSHVLEIDGFVKDNSLQFQWTYSRELHDRKTIERLAGSFIEKLRGIAGDYATIPDRYIPSDFPLIELTSEQLDRIVAIHGRVDDVYALSPMQQGMLFHSLYEPDKGTYLTQFVCEIHGDLENEIFRGAWQHVVRHYSALRASFESEVVSEQPVQIIRQSVELPWTSEDWSSITQQHQEELLNAYLRRDHKQGMDPQYGPLMRFFLGRTGTAKHVFIWSSHHLLLDGWSLPIVLKDAFAAYEDLRKKESLILSPERRPYRNYVDWLSKQDLAAAEKFWRSLLAGFTVPTSLTSFDGEHAVNSNTECFCEQEVFLTEPETARLSEFAREHHLTLSTIAHAAWSLLLAKVTGKSDVVFGVVVAGRQMRGAETMVGVFINTLPVRARIDAAERLEDYLEKFQRQQSEAAQFEYAPLSSIQAWSDIPRGKQLFETIVVFENYPGACWSVNSQTLQISNLRSLERSNYPLTLWIMPGQQLSLKIGYDSRLLDCSKTNYLLNEYRSLLEAIARAPNQNVSELLQAVPCWRNVSAADCSQTSHAGSSPTMIETNKKEAHIA